MKKTIKRILTGILAVALLFGSTVSYGEPATHDPSYAGTSRLLSNYLLSSKDAYDNLAYRLAVLKKFAENTEVGETKDPVTYEMPLQGFVCTPGTLNIRERESVLADVVAIAYAQRGITVVGEHLIQGKLWYEVDYAGTKGYASADYIKFGDDALRYFTEMRSLIKNTSVLPKPLEILDYVPDMASADLTKLQNYIKIVNECLTSTYPTHQAKGNYMNMYSILVYILENYSRIIEITVTYNMTETYAQASKDMQTVTLLRENLTNSTGTSDEEFSKQVAQAAKERMEREKYTLGERIANYAATFIGILPYVWGGASLTRGADCSGFCGQIYAHFGLIDQAKANAHAYDSLAFRNVGRPVELKDIQPGDLVCYQGHVAIFWGWWGTNGVVVHEPSIGRKCDWGPLTMMPIITIRRLIP